ncbi:MAG: TniQ family protein [Trichormus sp. ATA11-4-KO1]|jgi:hypothetical protein|nr:TniQ family protein [Trichormus sp. ATA11-4-KO1]
MNLLADSLTTYDSWNLQQLPIPPRSRLYSLEPAGAGTPTLESLTSYVIRLAQEHGLRPGVLIGKLIAPLIRPDFVYSDAQSGIRAIWGGNSAQTSMLNGAGKTVVSVIEVLERLTLRNDLRSLTVLSWAEVLASQGLLRSFKAWCPTCYEMQNLTHHGAYDPLIWSFNLVTICPIHQTRLFQKCPYCERVPSLLKSNSLPGYCPHCSRWLGHSSSLESLPEHELNWQLWVVGNIGQLLVAGNYLRSPVPQARIKEVLKLYINYVTGGKINAFSRIIEQPETSFHNWVIDKAKPQLNQLLKICFHLNTSLTNFLITPTNEIGFSELKQFVSPPIQCPKKRNRLNRPQVILILQDALEEFPPPSFEMVIKRLNTNRTVLKAWVPDICRSISQRYREYRLNQKIANTRTLLQAVIENDDLPPPSLMEVARQVKITGYPYFWREHCSDLCDTISARHSQYRKAESKKRKSELYEEIRQVALSLHQKGIKPTSGKVSALLTKPAVLLRPHVRAEFKKIRRELGYEK